MDMELYATGFNAWRQLGFNISSETPEEPDDITSFRSVLKDQSVERPYASLSYTLVNTSTKSHCTGSAEELSEAPRIKAQLLSSSAAIAGNGKVAAYDEDKKLIYQYSSLSLAERGEEQTSYGAPDRIVQLVAYETGFAALTARGDVMTWGDERYCACLGREPTLASPAEYPGIVEELQDLPTGKIKNIAAGGYVLLALTEGNDLYAWGGHPGRPALIEGGISGSPAPVIVEEHDITDCAVGESHIIVLTEEGYVYVVGDNTNGQLGLSDKKKVAAWTKVAIPFTSERSAGEVVVAVEAGPRSSFVLTKHQRS